MENNILPTQDEIISIEEEVAEELPATEEEKQFSAEYVKKLRKENARYRTSLKELQRLYEKFPPEVFQEYKELKESAAKQAEDEKARRAQENAIKIQELITRAADSLGAVAPKQVALLLKEQVSIDDAGAIFASGEQKDAQSFQEFVAGFLNENLHLVRNKSAKKGGNTSPHIHSTFSADQISAMSVQQYEKHRDRILKSLGQA